MKALSEYPTIDVLEDRGGFHTMIFIPGRQVILQSWAMTTQIRRGWFYNYIRARVARRDPLPLSRTERAELRRLRALLREQNS